MLLICIQPVYDGIFSWSRFSFVFWKHLTYERGLLWLEYPKLDAPYWPSTNGPSLNVIYFLRFTKLIYIFHAVNWVVFIWSHHSTSFPSFAFNRFTSYRSPFRRNSYRLFSQRNYACNKWLIYNDWRFL